MSFAMGPGADRRVMAALVRRGESLRRLEMSRSRRLRANPEAAAVADQLTVRLLAALLEPVAAYLHDNPDQAYPILRMFDLDEVVPQPGRKRANPRRGPITS
jgi:hypothetical protein